MDQHIQRKGLLLLTLRSLKVTSWTHVIQTWTHIPTKRSIDISHFSPYGMNLYTQNMKSLPSFKSSYQALPKEIRDEFPNEIKKENYKADNITITTRITGKKQQSRLIKYTVITVKGKLFQEF